MAKAKRRTVPDTFSSAEPRWQFWIDVGGTFTDCIARPPDGALLRHKLLSSGVTKGRTQEGSTGKLIRDAARHSDPHGIWQGYCCQLLDEQGRVVDNRLSGRTMPPRARLNWQLPFAFHRIEISPTS